MQTKSKSPTTTEPPHARKGVSRKSPLVERRLPKHFPPTRPGEMLLEEFLKPLGISQSAFAIRLGVSFPRLNEIIRGKRSVTPDTALRLARVLGMSADFWLGLQQDWDLWHAMHGSNAAEIEQLEPLQRRAQNERPGGRRLGELRVPNFRHRKYTGMPRRSTAVPARASRRPVKKMLTTIPAPARVKRSGTHG